MDELKPVEVKIDSQGAPMVDHGWIEQDGEKVVAIGIDMQSRCCEISATGADEDIPIVAIEAGESSWQLDPDKNRDELTCISLPEYKGWDVWVAHIQKSLLTLCLIKGEK